MNWFSGQRWIWSILFVPYTERNKAQNHTSKTKPNERTNKQTGKKPTQICTTCMPIVCSFNGIQIECFWNCIEWGMVRQWGREEGGGICGGKRDEKQLKAIKREISFSRLCINVSLSRHLYIFSLSVCLFLIHFHEIYAHRLTVNLVIYNYLAMRWTHHFHYT